MGVSIRNLQRSTPIDTRWVAKTASAIRDHLCPHGEIGILLVGDRRMQALNRRFRGVNRTTDVLAFAFREGPGGKLHPEQLGDVVICLPQVRRQARAAERSLHRETAWLLAHGILHLLGYDHERSRREAARMRRKEREVLRRIGALVK